MFGGEDAPIHRAIKEAGYKACLVSVFDRVAKGQSSSDPKANFDYYFSVNSDDSIQEIAKKLRSNLPHISALIPTSEPFEELASRTAQALHLPHNDPGVVPIRQNKGLAKDLVAKAGLRVPKHKICRSQGDVRNFARENSFPIIIKSPEGGAGVNVFKCLNKKDLLAKHEWILSQPNNWGRPSTSSVVEEYIGGTHYLANTFSDGRSAQITDIWAAEVIDTKFAANLFYNSSLVDPTDASVVDVSRYAVKIAEAVGIVYGPGSIQLKVDEKGPALIEAHARFTGGQPPEIVKDISNFDPFKAAVEVFTKGSTTIPKEIRFSSHFAIVACPSIWTCEKGQTVGIEEIQHLPSFYASNPKHDADLYSVQPTLTNRQKVPLVVWLAGPDQNQIQKDIERVHELFRIVCH